MVSKVLVVTGMHRSGTSLVANYLSECHLYMGSDIINSEDQEKVGDSFLGHHEDLDFLNFHMEVFRKRRKDVCGLFIQNSRSLSRNMIKLPIKLSSTEYSQAMKLISARNHLYQWGWKDPRTTLFLDFWHDLIDSPSYLLLFRHPSLVVDSLVRRSKDIVVNRNSLNGLKAWIIYNLEILKFQKNHPETSLVYEIDSVISHPNAFIDSLKNQLEVKELNYVDLDRFFTKKAFHTTYSDQTLALAKEYSKIFDQAMMIYTDLQKISE